MASILLNVKSTFKSFINFNVYRKVLLSIHNTVYYKKHYHNSKIENMRHKKIVSKKASISIKNIEIDAFLLSWNLVPCSRI